METDLETCRVLLMQTSLRIKLLFFLNYYNVICDFFSYNIYIYINVNIGQCTATKEYISCDNFISECMQHSCICKIDTKKSDHGK